MNTNPHRNALKSIVKPFQKSVYLKVYFKRKGRTESKMGQLTSTYECQVRFSQTFFFVYSVFIYFLID